MYILDDLWFGNLSPYSKPYRSGDAYAQLFHRFTEQYETLRGMLSGETLERFESSQRTRDELTAVSEQDRFIDGFCLGARLMLDVLCEPETPPNGM